MADRVWAVYARLSKEDATELTAVGRQSSACGALAEARGWPVGIVLEDTDASAFDPKAERPRFVELCGRIRCGDVAGVVVWKLDRLVRRPAEFEQFWALCQAHGVMLASVTEPIDTTTELGLAMVRILVTFASLEVATMSLRMRAKFEQNARAGRPATNGQRPYGLSDDRLHVVEEEAAVLREAAAKILAGASTRSVVNDLTARGVPTPRGSKRWQDTSMRQILLAPRLRGDRVYRGEVVATGCYPVIIDPDTHRRLVEVLTARGRGWSNRKAAEARLLSGVLRCAECGHVMYIVQNSHKGPSYACPPRPEGCNGVSVVQRIAEDTVADLIDRHYAEAATLEMYHQAEAELDRQLTRLAEDCYVHQRLTIDAYLECRAQLLHGRLDPPEHDMLRGWRDQPLAARRRVVQRAMRFAVVHRAAWGRWHQPDRIRPVWRAVAGPQPEPPARPVCGLVEADPERWVRIEQACRIAGGIHRRTLSLAAARGELRPVKSGPHVYYQVDDLGRWVEQHRVQPGTVGAPPT